MQWEFDFLNYLHDSLHSSFCDNFMLFFSKIGNGGLIWIITAIILIMFKNYRKAGMTILISLALGLLIGNLTMKPLFSRARPFNAFEDIVLIIAPPSDHSFPSGHTLSSFAAATSLFTYKKRIGILALLIASVIAISRMYLFVHYPTDILGGIAVGVGCALFARGILNKIKVL